MGPASEWGIDHKPGTENFTKNWRHQSQTLTTIYSASRFKARTQFSLADLSKRKNLFAVRNGDFPRLTIWVFGSESKNPSFSSQTQKIKTLKRVGTHKEEVTTKTEEKQSKRSRISFNSNQQNLRSYKRKLEEQKSLKLIEGNEKRRGRGCWRHWEGNI